MTQFLDDQLGMITIRRSPGSHSLRMRLSPKGEIIVSAPKRTPVAYIKRVVRQSRDELAQMKAQSQPDVYIDGQQIGHSHSLAIIQSDRYDNPSFARKGRVIIVQLPAGMESSEILVQTQIRDEVRLVLRKEAKAYLPKRLATLAGRHGYSYNKVRFPHTISRWGSCSSSGTISLNIALMKLPLDLIDYVILHELAHTVEMNHSKSFWSEVEVLDPDYALHRKQLKAYSPII